MVRADTLHGDGRVDIFLNRDILTSLSSLLSTCTHLPRKSEDIVISWESKGMNTFITKDRELELFFFFPFFLFKAASMSYGSSQAGGHIGAVVAGLCHSHSKAGSEHLL